MVDQVCDRLRQDLLSGAVAPGSRILTNDVCARFGISHVPVREALRLLEGEGFVTSSGGGAIMAATLSLEDAMSLYDLRRMIELPVGRRAAQRATEADIAALQAVFAQLEDLRRSPESSGYWTVHREFHWLVLAPGATDWVKRILDQLWQNCERFVRISAMALGTMDEATRDHADMVTAVEARDGVRLEAIIAQHLTRTEDALRSATTMFR